MIGGRRAVVTGLGLLAANGNSTEEFFRNLLACRSGVATISLFDASEFKCQIAGEVKNFTPEQFGVASPAKVRRMARHTQFALAAVQMALADAGLTKGFAPAMPVPVIVGVSTSGIDVLEGLADRMSARGPARVAPYTLAFAQPHAVASAIAASLEFDVRTQTISTACQAGLDAIATAAHLVRSGKTDIAIAGGADAAVTPWTCATFSVSGLLSLRNDDPARASRPFDRDRDGGVLAEGSGVVVIESLEHALGRGVEPYLEIKGYGTSVDCNGDDAGTNLYRSMFDAIANAGRRPEDVDYICAHGPSDPTIDRVESAMIKRVLGEARARCVPISSIKGVTGNPLSAAGPLELAACALAIRHGVIPPRV